jgi:hypothetical protein
VTGANGTEYSQDVLITGLRNGLTENGWFDGSYEQYLNEYTNSDDYQKNNSESALMQYRD